MGGGKRMNAYIYNSRNSKDLIVVITSSFTASGSTTVEIQKT